MKSSLNLLLPFLLLFLSNSLAGKDVGTESRILSCPEISVGYERLSDTLTYSFYVIGADSLPQGNYSWQLVKDGFFEMATEQEFVYDFPEPGSYSISVTFYSAEDSCQLVDEILLEVDSAIYGCTDPGSANYNPSATVDDGSCVNGSCSDISIGSQHLGDTLTYRLFVYESDSLPGGSYSWQLTKGDFTDTITAEEFNYTFPEPGSYAISVQFEASEDSCQLFAEIALEVDSAVVIYGCMDPGSANYNPSATVDDGSCVNGSCSDISIWYEELSDTLTYSFYLVGDDSLPAGNYSWQLSKDSTFSDSVMTQEFIYTFPEPGLYSISVQYESLEDSCLVSDVIWLEVDHPEVIHGCTDPGSINYNPAATIDDGSCAEPVCFDEITIGFFTGGNLGYVFWVEQADSLPFGTYSWEFSKDNFVDTATGVVPNYTFPGPGTYRVAVQFEATNDSCSVYTEMFLNLDSAGVIFGCMDPGSANYNPMATVDDGSCVDASCVDIAVSYTQPGDSTTYRFHIVGADTLPEGSYSWELTKDSVTVTIIGKEIAYDFPEPGEYQVRVEFKSLDDSCIVSAEIFLDVSPQQAISGCMNPEALNYNPLATVSSGTCVFSLDTVLGCTDPLALNYDSAAIYNDGSCEYDPEDFPEVTMGCTDPVAINYKAGATVDNGSCKYGIRGDVFGCTDVNALNYRSDATVDNGSCQYSQAHLDTASHLIPGCKDVTALNYSETAILDNGSCIYAQDTVLAPIVLPKNKEVLEVIPSSVGSSCEIDYSRLIDSVSISEYSVSGSELTITWLVYQRGESFTVVSVVDVGETELIEDGNYLLYCTISCEDINTRAAQTGRVIRGVLATTTRTTGIGSRSEMLHLFPNPFTGSLTLHLPQVNDGMVLKMMNLAGQEVFSEQLCEGVNVTNISTAHLVPGIYVVSLIGQDGRFLVSSKVIKE